MRWGRDRGRGGRIGEGEGKRRWRFQRGGTLPGGYPEKHIAVSEAKTLTSSHTKIPNSQVGGFHPDNPCSVLFYLQAFSTAAPKSQLFTSVRQTRFRNQKKENRDKTTRSSITIKKSALSLSLSR